MPPGQVTNQIRSWELPLCSRLRLIPTRRDLLLTYHSTRPIEGRYFLSSLWLRDAEEEANMHAINAFQREFSHQKPPVETLQTFWQRAEGRLFSRSHQ